jgi:adenylate kinase
MNTRPRVRWFALTGTPGTGKTAIAAALRARGLFVLSLSELAEDCGAVEGPDERRPGTRIVDEDVLADAFASVRATFRPYRQGKGPRWAGCEGHYAHDMPVESVLILRTAPWVLQKRLLDRGWAREKVRENMEAEAFGIITSEAEAPRGARSFERRLAEIDTSTDVASVSAAKVLAWLRMRGDSLPSGVFSPQMGRWPLDALPFP